MPEHREADTPALLLALALVVVVTYLIVQRWKSALEKKEKIKMLVVLAAEEAARVEAMSTSQYRALTGQQCAICSNPAATRCSRCKAARYCSGRCQIIHWRQGHKQECQQPDIHNSSTCTSYVSTIKCELDSTVSYSQAQELRSLEHDLQGPRTSPPAAQKLDPSNSETLETALEAREISMLKIGPEVNSEISDLRVVSMTGSVLDATHMSNVVTKSPDSCAHLFVCHPATISSTKDAPMYDIPSCESSATDVPLSCSASSSNILSSDPSGSRNTITDVPLPETFVSDSLTNSVDATLCSKVPKPNISSCESHTKGGAKSFQHGLHNSARPTHDLPASGSQTFDFSMPKRLDDTSSNSNSPAYRLSTTNSADASSNSNNPAYYLSTTDGPDASSNSNNAVCYLSTTKGARCHSSRSKNCVVDESRVSTVMLDIPNDGLVLDESSCRSSVSDISSYEASMASSPRLESSVSNNLSSMSSLHVSYDGNSPTCSDSKFQNPMRNEQSTGMSASTIKSPNTTVSNTTRLFGASLQCSSPPRVMAAVCTVSCQGADNHNAVLSNEINSNGLKKSEKKAVHQPKSSKGSKQAAAVTVNKSLAKPTKMLFPYEQFVKLFSSDELELPPCGLINCGNSCYANVVLQCLTYTRPLAAYLLQQSHSKECRVKDWCLMCELEHLVARVRAGENPLSPIRILSRIRNIGNHLGYGSQEDAHEFLRFVINTMQSICLDEAGGEKTVDSRMQETTFIQQIFGGYLQSKVKCMRCQHESDRYENMMDLTVEIHGNVESLEDALSRFTAPELLDGENKYKCDRCKTYVKARKQLAVHEAPNILTIALKRFQGGNFGKLNKCVTFPDVLDMTPYMSGISDKPPLYKLYAVVVHIDMLNASFFGHYVCYVKNYQGNWYKIDDSEVRPVDIEGVMSEGAYMLLYSRTSPRCPTVASDRITETCTTSTINHWTYDVEQSLLLNGREKGFGVHGTQFLSLHSTTGARIEESLVRFGNLNECANGVDRCSVNMNAFGYNCDRLPLIARDGYMDSISIEYSDLISSEAGSLFSGSDEASCSTDSNRDSTSTVDIAETVFGDSGSVDCSSTSGSESSSSVFHSGFCLKSSQRPPQSKCFYENDVFLPDSSFSNQQLVRNTHLGKRRLEQGFSLLPDPPPPLETNRLGIQHSVSASSHDYHLSVNSSLTANDDIHSALPSRQGNKLGYRLRYTNRNVLQQTQNSISVPDVSETGAYLKGGSSLDFAIPTKRQYVREKSISEFQEAGKAYFVVPSRSYNVTSNFERSFVQDTRKSCSATVHSLGFDR